MLFYFYFSKPTAHNIFSIYVFSNYFQPEMSPKLIDIMLYKMNL